MTEEQFKKSYTMNTATGCWIWSGFGLKAGYGRAWMNGRSILAHRVAYGLWVGPIPKGLFVLHRCDNPPCINPDHLWLGTLGDNNRDRDQKGRTAKGDRSGARLHPASRARGDRNGLRLHPECVARGERAGQAKLNVQAIAAIRAAVASGASVSEVARHYPVSRQAVKDIISGRTWRHIPTSPSTSGRLLVGGR